MANPNDIAKALNEMMNTLQELSKKELESVEDIIKEQKKILDTEKKTIEAKQELYRITKEISKTDSKIKDSEKKNLKEKNELLTSIQDSTKKFSKTSFKIGFGNSPSVKDLLSKVSVKLIDKTPAKISTTRSTQSLLDFTRKEDAEDIQDQQLHTLKEIDKKITDMSSVGSGGLFDFLANGLGDFVTKTISSVLGIGAAGASGGLLGGLGGLAKGKLGKIAKTVGRVAKSGKGKVGLIAAGASAVGLAGLGAYKQMSGNSQEDSEEVEPRQFGGKTVANKTYLVGEDGPELFSPKSNGEIIPNHKLQKNTKIGFSDNLIEVVEDFRKGFNKNLGTLMGKFTGTFKSFSEGIWEKVSGIYTDIKDWVMGYVNSIKDKASDIIDKSKSVLSDMFDKVKNMILPTPVPQPTQIPVPKNVEKSTSEILSKMNPMKVPDITIQQTPITVETNYNPTNITQELPQNELDKDFWVNQFLPAFANSLATKKSASKFRTVPSSSPW